MYTINNNIHRTYYYEKSEETGYLYGKEITLYGVKQVYTEFDTPARKTVIPNEYEDIKSAIIHAEADGTGIGADYTFGFIVTKTFNHKRYMGLLSETGHEIIPCNRDDHKYAYINFGNTYYSNCLDVAKYDRQGNLKYGLITINSQFIHSPTFSIPCVHDCLTFSKKTKAIEATKTENEKTLRGVIDYSGKIITPFRAVKRIKKSDVQFFDYATDFDSSIGIALVKNENGYFYINTYGERVSEYYSLAFQIDSVYINNKYQNVARAYKDLEKDNLLLVYDKKAANMEEINIDTLPEDTAEKLKLKKEILRAAKANTYTATKVSTVEEIKNQLVDLRSNGFLHEGGYESNWMQKKMSNPQVIDSLINGYRIAGRESFYNARAYNGSNTDSTNNFFYQDASGKIQKQLGYWFTITPFNKHGYATVSFINKKLSQESYIIDVNGNVYSTPVPISQLRRHIDHEKEELNPYDYEHNSSISRSLEFDIKNGIIIVDHQADPSLYPITHSDEVKYYHFGYRVIETEKGCCYQNASEEYILKPNTLSKGEVQKRLKDPAFN